MYDELSTKRLFQNCEIASGSVAVPKAIWWIIFLGNIQLLSFTVEQTKHQPPGSTESCRSLQWWQMGESEIWQWIQRFKIGSQRKRDKPRSRRTKTRRSKGWVGRSCASRHTAKSSPLSDFHLLGPLKDHLVAIGMKTTSNWNFDIWYFTLKTAVKEWIRSCSADLFSAGFQRCWVDRWQKCVQLNGDYME